jgi:hypothetical protein
MPVDRKRRAKYLGFVAHEIKNPLSTALWSADLLRRLAGEDRAGPRADRMVDASLRALRRMRRLVEDYFTIERLDDDLLELRSERTALRALYEAAIASMSDKERDAAAAFRVDVPEPLLVACDPELVKRALRALVERVARFGEGPLSIVGGSDGPLATLWIGRPGAAPSELVPPPPEEQTGGDPDGAVLGYELAQSVARAHRGFVEARDGGLVFAIPAAS